MKIRCPICHKETRWSNNKYRPFCSERCKLIDLGLWAGEDYRIVGDDFNSLKGKEKQKKL